MDHFPSCLGRNWLTHTNTHTNTKYCSNAILGSLNIICLHILNLIIHAVLLLQHTQPDGESCRRWGSYRWSAAASYPSLVWPQLLLHSPPLCSAGIRHTVKPQRHECSWFYSSIYCSLVLSQQKAGFLTSIVSLIFCPERRQGQLTSDSLCPLELFPCFMLSHPSIFCLLFSSSCCW